MNEEHVGPLQLVDTHCHIQSAGNSAGERQTHDIWAKDPSLRADQIVENANADGVSKLLCVGCDLADSQLAINFVQNHSQCWASIGLHPHEAQNYIDQPEKLAEFSTLASHAKVVAIGECGLDYFYEHSPRKAQFEILKFQIELALQAKLPMIFHVREAFNDFWPIFDSYDGIRGVVHSFTDDKVNLERALERGLSIGVNGIATFAKDPAQLEVYKAIPLGRLLLETDAPFLTPTPFRGSINEPKHILTVAKFLSSLRGESLEQISKQTTTNAVQLFNLNTSL